MKNVGFDINAALRLPQTRYLRFVEGLSVGKNLNLVVNVTFELSNGSTCFRNASDSTATRVEATRE